MDDTTPEAAHKLKLFIEKIERMEDEKTTLLRDIKDVFDDAKNNGFDPKIMKQVIRCRKMKRDDYLEQEQLLATYLSAVGLA